MAAAAAAAVMALTIDQHTRHYYYYYHYFPCRWDVAGHSTTKVRRDEGRTAKNSWAGLRLVKLVR